jgi:hypothetical protein
MGTDLILLTAAIVPDTSFRNALSDPEQRLGQYRTAIRTWSDVASATGCKLMIVETSGSGHLLADQAETVSFTPSLEAKNAGKGAAEAEALEAGLRVADLAEHATFHKVTGRLALRNWKSAVLPVTAGTVRVRRSMDRSYCDVRFFSVTRSFWDQYLQGMSNEVHDVEGRYLEHVMAQRLVLAEYAGVHVERFPERPSFMGSSGTSGNSYGSIKERMLSPLLLRAENILSSVGAGKQL